MLSFKIIDREIKPARKNLHSLTRLRAVAALTVAVYHTLPAWPHYAATGLASYGFLGVSFFFCLSGFVNQWGWGNRSGHAGEFLFRRVAKIYPLSLLTLLIAIGIIWNYSIFSGYKGSNSSILWSALLLQSWWYDAPDIRQSWNGVSWTISCEMLFYLVSPIFLPLISRFNRSTAVIALMFIIAGYWLTQYLFTEAMGPDFFEFFPVSRLPEYVAGALAAQILAAGQIQRRVFSVPMVFLVAIAAPLVLLYGLQPDAYPTTQTCFTLLGFVAVVYASASNDLAEMIPPRTKPLTTRALDYLGKISYSLYMTHGIVLGCVARLLATSPFVEISTQFQGELTRLFFIAVAIYVASVTYFGFERPIFNRLVALLAKTAPKP